jgi:hypothetical protein
MEQAPRASIVTVLPDIVQMDGVLDVNPTASPELAVAATVNGGAPSASLPGALNVILCVGVWRCNRMLSNGASVTCGAADPSL